MLYFELTSDDTSEIFDLAEPAFSNLPDPKDPFALKIIQGLINAINILEKNGENGMLIYKEHVHNNEVFRECIEQYSDEVTDNETLSEELRSAFSTLFHLLQKESDSLEKEH